MAWWDTIIDAGSGIWDWAKQNPTTAGAVAGLVTGGGTGNYGEANFRNAAGGAAIGYTAGQLFGGSSAPITGDTGPSAGRQNVPSFSSGEVSSAVAPTTVSVAAPTSFGSMGSPNFDTMSGSEFEKYASGGGGSTLESVFNTAKDSVGKVQQFGKQYAAPIDLGLKGMKLLGDRAASEAQGNAQRDYAARLDQADAAQNARSDELGSQIRSTNDVGNETRRAYASTVDRAGAQAAGLKKTIMAKGGSAATAEAEARRARIAGSTGAVSAATTAGQTAGKNMVAGLSSLKYSNPSAAAATARETAAGIDAGRNNDLYAFGQYALGNPNKTVRENRGEEDAAETGQLDPYKIGT